ncbi:MAG: transglycosylase SLT domain-containing protein [Elusimicrobia bacterium]|nr:transglycosylase SLT domain-containing protein [Elusimicrobiota bacterium]
MRAFLPLVVLLAGACAARRGVPAVPAPAAAPAPALAPVSTASAGEAEGEEDSGNLALAEAAYEEGLSSFEGGRPFEGRAGIRKAFGLLTDELQDPGLASALKDDFLAMLGKARSWEPVEPSERPALAVAEEELRSATPARLQAQVGKHRIAVDPDNEITRKFISIYTRQRPKSVEEALGRSGRYRAMMLRRLREAGLPEELFYLVMTESEYLPMARSRTGAAGLWQFMPGTARRYGLKVSFWVDERYDPEKATAAAVRYLKDLREWFGDWHLAVAAYNRGENGIGRDLAFTRATDFGTVSRRGALPGETQHYVPKFMACVLIGEDPGRYGLRPVYEEPFAFDTAEVDKPLSLAVAAQAAGVPEDRLKALNPELAAWATPPETTYALRVPKGSREAFLSALAQVKDWNPGPELVRYRVQAGDSLGKIAGRFRTTVKAVMALNGLKTSRRLRPGTVLKVRPGRKKSSRR